MIFLFGRILDTQNQTTIHVYCGTNFISEVDEKKGADCAHFENELSYDLC